MRVELSGHSGLYQTVPLMLLRLAPNMAEAGILIAEDLQP